MSVLFCGVRGLAAVDYMLRENQRNGIALRAGRYVGADALPFRPVPKAVLGWRDLQA